MRPSACRRVRGLSLIEVLVTLVLLGVGLLGLAGLQLRGMQVNQGSAFRSQAAILAEDLIDRMRADPVAVGAGKYIGSYPPACGLVSPATTTLALVNDWLARLASLPGACATVAADAPFVTVTVSWTDDRASQAAGTGAATGSVRLVTEIAN